MTDNIENNEKYKQLVERNRKLEEALNAHRIEPFVSYGYVIIGPYGNIWYKDIFEKEDEAKKFLNDTWKGNRLSIDSCKIIPGKRTVIAIGGIVS